jgi:hypothetical protein
MDYSAVLGNRRKIMQTHRNPNCGRLAALAARKGKLPNPGKRHPLK